MCECIDCAEKYNEIERILKSILNATQLFFAQRSKFTVGMLEANYLLAKQFLKKEGDEV